MIFQVVLVVALASSALARPGFYSAPTASVPARYNYMYTVNNNFGNNFGHQESRNGYDTRGSYFVQLPDGRLQKVTYTVNGNSGFVAQVRYTGEARHPPSRSSNTYGAYRMVATFC
ncbi:cuticle protein 21-like [Penaeus monodon]|uniref:cuticle protein 21-like n=1 Tax=Penaeus monodon TaxID=6687 RepID=UPI0018A7E0D2|nr:cuticle protein 21-like [Penaeus monodon]